MEFMLIRRLSDGKYLGEHAWDYTDDPRAMAVYVDEDQALITARSATHHNEPAEVVYVTTSISNVKG